LELARDLIRRAQWDPSQPIPIVLNLSSWAYKRKPLGQWLLDELVLQEQVPRQVGADWLEAGALLLLLDGLDEVRAEHRQECVRVINAYRQRQGFVPLAVCSRSADYAMLTSKFKLGGAVVIQPLTHEQVDTHLANQGPRLAAARALVNHDPVLRELAQTPLILSLIAQTFDNEAIGQDTTLASAETWRQRLFSSYVHQMLGRRGARAHYGEQDTIRWLVFLTRTMREHNVSVFSLENLQKTWLASRRQIILHEWIVVLMVWVIPVLLAGVLILKSTFPSWFKVLAMGSLLIFLLFYWRLKLVAPIVSVEAMGWSWSSFRDGLRVSIVDVSILASLGVAMVFSAAVSETGLVVAAFGVAYLLIMNTLSGGVIRACRFKKVITPSARPNHGIHQSAKTIAVNFFLISLLFAVVGAFAGILVARTLVTILGPYLSLWMLSLLGSSLAATVAIGVAGGFLGLFLGLLPAWVAVDPCAILGHLSLRLLLAKSNLVPLTLVRFLDFCDERLLLRKIGGRYVSFHRLLLDYFAALPELSSKDCHLDHSAEEIAAMKRGLLVPFFRAYQHFSLGRAFLRQGDLPQASQHFRINQRLWPKNGLGANVHLGVLAWHAGQKDSARQTFEAALRVYDSSKRSGSLPASACLELRSCALLGLDRVEEAESALQEALACRPYNDGLPLDEMWRLLQSCKHPPEGIERLTALLSPP
jgi:hypothetical protein